MWARRRKAAIFAGFLDCFDKIAWLLPRPHENLLRSISSAFKKIYHKLDRKDEEGPTLSPQWSFCDYTMNKKKRHDTVYSMFSHHFQQTGN